MHGGIDDRGRGVGTHAAGVRAGVAVAFGLMVLRCSQWQDVFTICHDDEACFLAFQKFFNHHPVSGVAEGVTGQHVEHSGFGLCCCVRDDHALAGSQAVGLHDNRCSVLADEFNGRGDFREVTVGCCRDAVAGHEILGKGFGTFQLGGSGVGPETNQVGRAESIDNTVDQGVFRADDGQFNPTFAGKFEQSIQIADRDGHVLNTGFACRSGITGCHKNFLNARGACRLPGQCMFASTTSYHQDFHISV